MLDERVEGWLSDVVRSLQQITDDPTVETELRLGAASGILDAVSLGQDIHSTQRNQRLEDEDRQSNIRTMRHRSCSHQRSRS